MRLGDLIDALAVLSTQLPDGRDSEVLFGACDGQGLTTTTRAEVTTLTRADADGTITAMTPLIRTHVHAGDATRLPGVATHVDTEDPTQH